MSYELQVYALSPVRPTLRELLAQAGESGLTLEPVGAAEGEERGGVGDWTRLLLRSVSGSEGGIAVDVSAELDAMRAQLEADRAAGEAVPEQVLQARALYVVSIDGDDERPAFEEDQAGLVVATWALAAMTDGIVFDPQEEFFADADSFWAIITDEDALDEDDGDETGDPNGPRTMHSFATLEEP